MQNNNTENPNINVQSVPPLLRDFFKKHRKVALAFSGGVDSAYLLYAAKVCGADVCAFFAHTPFQPKFEVNDAHRMAKEQGVPLCVLPIDVLNEEQIAQNTAERCYFCKVQIMQSIIKAAGERGYTVLLDGSNASDDESERPGMRALKELSVLSPLRLAGITKQQVRALSKSAGLFTWDKPAYACLATRISTGQRIDKETLSRVQSAEAALMEMGFSDIRVRVRKNSAKLQLPQSRFGLALQKHKQIAELLLRYFDEAVLDLTPRG